MHYRRTAGLVAGLSCLAAVAAAPAATAAAPANVTVRIEGKSSTIVEEQRLTTTVRSVSDGETAPCTGTSALGAMDQSVAGDWDGDDTYGTTFVERIRGENYPLGATPDGWEVWVNHKAASVGPCDIELQEGDEVLYLVSRCEFDTSTNTCANEPVVPLELRAPATARAGDPVTLSVVEYDSSGTPSAAENARIVGPGINVAARDGTATIQFPQAGEFRLKAERAGAARSGPEIVRVAPAGGAPAAPAAPLVAPDISAPVSRILGIREQQRFRRARAPRTLRGSVAPDPSGLRAVKLSLTRSHRGRCWRYSPTRERFSRSRCGRRVYFSIGDRQDWTYLLPERLARGRFVLDAVAIDKQGNRDPLARGRNRVVFFVR